MNNRKKEVAQKDDYLEGEFAVEIPDGFECPVTTDLMEDPVIAADGHSYEQAAIKQWLSGGRRISPMTGEKLHHTLLTPNHALRKAIQAFLKQRPGLAAIKRDIQAKQSLDQQMRDLLLAIQIRENDLEAQAAKKPKELRQAGQAVLDEKEGEIEEPMSLLQAAFNPMLQPIAMDEITAIAHQRHNPRTQIADTLLKVNKTEVTLNTLSKENAANKIKRFHLKFRKSGLKRWMKASRLHERQASLSHQLEQSLEKKAKQAHAFRSEWDQQVDVDTKAVEAIKGDYEIKIKETASAGAWNKLALLAKEAEETQQALQIRQKQALDARIEAFKQSEKQHEAEQLRLKQELYQIISAKADKQRGLLQRVNPIAQLTTVLHANAAQQAIFLEKQNTLVTLLREQTEAQYRATKAATEAIEKEKAEEAQRKKEAEALESKEAETEGRIKVYSHFWKPAQQTPPQVAAFLRLVAEGEQDKAEAMLKANGGLALQSGTVTDLSNRTFKHITGFQYAVWAMDWHMWTMLLKYVPREEAALQLQALEENGTEHGKHFDLSRLVDTLDTYVKNYAAWNSQQRKTHWCQQVGGAQLLLPAHVVNEYCRPDRSFDPVPDFTKGNLPRVRTVYVNKPDDEWFSVVYNGGKIGNTFAAVRAGGGFVAIVEWWLCVLDHAATQKLMKSRELQLQGLKSDLLFQNNPVVAAKR